MLAAAWATRDHEFWTCSVSIVGPEVVRRDQLQGPRLVTDLYLLDLATHHQGRLVTLGRGVLTGSVPTAGAENLLVL